MQDEARKKEIKEAVMRTIVFFDIFSFPQTAMEIWQSLDLACTYAELDLCLTGMQGHELECSGGRYFLPGKEELLGVRARRYNYSNRKLKRARRMSYLFRLIPWIRLIAIGNLIGNNNLKDESDIDFFIICSRNRVWVSRFFSTLLTKVLFLRPRVNDTRDKICLSFYLSDSDLSLSPFHLRPAKDLYFRYWLANLQPLYDENGTYARLLQANAWIHKELPNWQVPFIIETRSLKPSYFQGFRHFLGIILGGLEKHLRRFQLKVLPNDLRTAMNQDTRVVMNEQVMKMHVNDRRQQYEDIYNKEIKRYL